MFPLTCDGLVDHTNAYRSQIQQLEQKLTQVGRSHQEQTAKIKELEGIITTGKAENEKQAAELMILKAQVDDLTDKAIAAEQGALANGKPGIPKIGKAASVQ